MPRQELSNVFSDGLMKDLNPINTPKSVLTDCLNGTYITYNGNEFVLQNDMGNYKLQNCKLPTNFIPVGVKGYADILYIVSYNPFTKEVEIGSYPAPQSIFSAGDTESPLASDDDLSPFKWADGVNEYEYPTIIKEQKKPLFIFTDTDEETFKLYPGDEFKFAYGTEDEGGGLKALEYYYQHLNFYVIDEDNKLYDLDDTLIYNIADSGTVSLVSNEMRKVFWETPGWLAAQYDLYVPDKFNLNLRSLNVPEFLLLNNDESVTQAEGDVPLDKKEPAGNQFKVSMDLSSQITITDLLFQAELNKPANVNTNGSYQDLYVRYLIKTADPASTPDDQKNEYGLFQGITYTEEGAEKPTDIIDASGTETNENGTYSYFDIPVWPHNYQDDVITAFNNIRPIWFYQKPDYSQSTETFDVLNYKGVVEITAYPIIKQHTNNQILKFTQFSTTQRFPLNTLKNSKDIFVANSIYKWSVDDDSCTISFNVDGPFINASDITGRYEIYRINLFKKSTEDEDSNPRSYSSWTGITLPERSKDDSNAQTAYLDTNNERQDFNLNNISVSGADTINPFFESDSHSKLLMCEGNISNLVLYGQNTLNIDWGNSDEYVLTGYQNYYTDPDKDDGSIKPDTNYDGSENSTKAINFSKEGGIYIFRVILEQNGSTLNTTDKILIPSEVFNKWFGSIDNYDNIYLNQWVSNLMNLISINNFEIIKITPNFSNYIIKLSKTINGETNIIDCDISSADDFQNLLESGEYLTTSKIIKSYSIQTSLSDLIDHLTITQNLDINDYKENLWNCIKSQTLNFDTLSLQYDKTTENGIEYKILSDTKLIDFIFVFQYLQKSLKQLEEDLSGYPFKSYVSFNMKSESDCGAQFAITGKTSGTNVSEQSIYGKGKEVKRADTEVFLNSERVFTTNKRNIANISASCSGCSGAMRYGGCIARSDNYSNPAENMDWGNWIDRTDENRDLSSYKMFRSANRADQNQYNGGVIVKFANWNVVRTILSNMQLLVYSNKPTLLNYDQITNTLTLQEQYLQTLSKVIFDLSIKLLKVDDYIYYYNTNLYDIAINLNNSVNKNNLISSLNNISLLKNIKLSIPAITINFDLTTNKSYKNLYLYGNLGISQYNDAILDEIGQRETANTGFYIDSKINYDKITFENLKNKFKGINGTTMTLENIGWECSNINNYMWAYNAERDGDSGEPRKRSGRYTAAVCLARYEEF